MSMDPPPSNGPGARRPFPVPSRPEPEESADSGQPAKIHARDLIDQLPEPDPALVRDPEPRRRRNAHRHRARSDHPRGRGIGHRRSWPQRILLSLLVLAAIVAGTGAVLAGYLNHKLDQISYIEVDLSTAPPPGEPRNLLIVGSDSRDNLTASEDATIDTSAFIGDDSVGSGQRSDTIIVVRVDPAATAVEVLSIPRDLWLPIADTDGSQRINTAYAGGPQRLVDTIEEQFDLPIHHYVEVDFVGFADLVEAVGGVPMWFDTPVRDTHSGLQVDSRGCHRLDSQSALAYARARHLQYQDDDGRWHTDGTGDLGRITRQQVFLRRAVDQVSNLGLTDAITLNRLLDVGLDNVTLSRGLGLSQLRDLSQRFANFDSDAMRTHAVPTRSFRTSGGALVEGLIESEAQPILNIFRGLPPGTLTPVQVDDVTVLNGTGVEGHAALVADALEQVGFGVAETGNVEADEVGTDNTGTNITGVVARTAIRHAPGAENAADLLERHLTAGADLVVDRTLDDGAVVLEIGTDLTTIGRNPRPSDGPPPTTEVADPGEDSSDEPTNPSPETEAEPIGVAPDPSVRCS